MKFISAKEHRTILIIISLCFILRILEILLTIKLTKDDPSTSFGLYDIFQITELMVPLYTILILPLIFIFLWKLSIFRVIYSPIFTILLSKSYLSWIIETREGISYLENYDFKFVDYFLFKGSFGDLICCFMIFSLFLWQLSIIVRFIINRFQSKSFLV
jgi:hypothetical protein